MIKAYRTKEMIKLIGNAVLICEIPYELILKIVYHIEIGYDDMIKVVFLAGVKSMAKLKLYHMNWC